MIVNLESDVCDLNVLVCATQRFVFLVYRTIAIVRAGRKVSSIVLPSIVPLSLRGEAASISERHPSARAGRGQAEPDRPKDAAPLGPSGPV